jgi:hypothetical protein
MVYFSLKLTLHSGSIDVDILNYKPLMFTAVYRVSSALNLERLNF